MARKSNKPPRKASASVDYEVGYGKPPLETRFKKGVSGNGRGRPKRDRTVNEVIEKVLARRVLGNVDGKTTSLPADEAIITRIVQLALNGDIKAAKLVLERMERVDAERLERVEGPGYGVLMVPSPCDPLEWELMTLLEVKKYPIMGPPDEERIKELREEIRKSKEEKGP